MATIDFDKSNQIVQFLWCAYTNPSNFCFVKFNEHDQRAIVVKENNDPDDNATRHIIEWNVKLKETDVSIVKLCTYLPFDINTSGNNLATIAKMNLSNHTKQTKNIPKHIREADFVCVTYTQSTGTSLYLCNTESTIEYEHIVSYLLIDLKKRKTNEILRDITVKKLKYE